MQDKADDQSIVQGLLRQADDAAQTGSRALAESLIQRVYDIMDVDARQLAKLIGPDFSEA